MLTVVSRQPDDLAGCLDVLWAVHQEDGYPMFWPSDPTRWLASRHEVAAWVARDSETASVVGHVAAHRVANNDARAIWTSASGLPAERLTVVSRLIVGPAHRRRGVGKVLLKAATRYAQEQGALPVLDVAQEGAAAISLYESLGWRRVGSVEVAAQQVIPGFAYLGPAECMPDFMAER